MASTYLSEAVSSPLEGLLSPTTSASGGIPRVNPLQARVTSVLSASYADLDIRDALAILDARDTHNTPELRRRFRLDVQEELIKCNGEVVQDFGRVAEQLRRVGTAISSLKSSCSEMRKHIDASKREIAPMLDEAKSIFADKSQIESKKQLLDAFSTHFVISDAELATLTSTAEPVDENFFRVLTRVKNVHKDCQILLGYENQRLGLEILEQSSKQLDGAFNKLYRWTQREFKTLDLENPQISAGIRRALRVLAERPSMFQSCLDAFAEARESILSNNFYAALTGAPVDKEHPVMGKAIELSAHDPLRYIGDMLAWAHSATVSEREALESLFISDGDEIAKSIQSGIESEPWTRESTGVLQAFDGRSALNDLVNRDLAGVCRQVRQRTEQVAQSHEDATLAYRISNLVTFYANIFSTLLGRDAALLNLLKPASETAMRSFSSIMHDKITQLQIDHYVSDDDFSPPEFLEEALETLQVLMKSYDTSASTADRAQRLEGFQPILQQALDPYLAGCETISRRLQPPGNHIFALNCLGATNSSLKAYAFADRSEELQPKLEEHAQELIAAMHRWFLHESGLDDLLHEYATADDLAPLYSDSAQLAAAAQKLDGFLPTATEDARAFLDQLEDKAVVRKVVESAAEKFCEDYEDVESLLVQADEKRSKIVNGDQADGIMLRDVYSRTNDEIRVLLS